MGFKITICNIFTLKKLHLCSICCVLTLLNVPNNLQTSFILFKVKMGFILSPLTNLPGNTSQRSGRKSANVTYCNVNQTLARLWTFLPESLAEIFICNTDCVTIKQTKNHDPTLLHRNIKQCLLSVIVLIERPLVAELLIVHLKKPLHNKFNLQEFLFFLSHKVL